ncbi:DUF1292 domain-containing protein [Mesobacillus sp. AQ2]|jgi:hypothetical protein|uniref:DUF1292 domain-containing protein n=1 Tax=Bacillaceae TaxID=186817 RepID=UPI0011A0CA9A|nr:MULTISPECIES: DUF1292 domain-containing protein [Bacillaceae]MCM3121791.1 DUF1292 domain-containing protein [Mesobacillus sp. MER 33]MCM3231755.1 DUF1292 domain-containing protein [Mesobacillus sp. MER 48]WHX38723.1 DUF1292 domain-containing protein [Mesobacillus sp. AQ2]
MDNDSVRDLVTVRDEMGNERQFEVEALFEMNGLSYAMLREGEETVVMKVEDQGEDQFLVGLESEGEKSNLLDAYQIAVDAAPAEE